MLESSKRTFPIQLIKSIPVVRKLTSAPEGPNKIINKGLAIIFAIKSAKRPFGARGLPALGTS